MDSIRALPTFSGAPTANPSAAPPQQQDAAPPQDSVVIGAAPQTQQQPPAAPQEAPPQQQAPPATVMPPQNPQGFVNVPVTLAVPIELVTPDEHGNVPISQYTPDLRPPGAIYTTQEHIQELVETVKKQTLPPGTHPELDNSPGGAKIDVAQKTFGKVMTSVGGIATYSLAREGARWTLPAAIAAPVALVAGGISLYTGLDQAKTGLNLKGYYEGLKKEGVESLPMQVPVRTKEGVQVQQMEVPIDQMISGAKDASVVGGLQSLSGGLMIAAGACMLAALPAAPALAIGSIVLSVAGPLYAARGQFAMVAKAAWSKIKEKLHIGGKEQAQEKKEPTIGDPSAAQAQVDPARQEPTVQPPAQVATGQEQPKS